MSAREMMVSPDSVSDPTPLAALLKLMAKRLMLGTDVAAAKFVSGGRIEDQAREAQILDKVKASPAPAGPGNNGGTARESAVSFFRDQMVASKVVQQGLHTYWRAHPDERPRSWRALAEEVRPQLDLINRNMLLLLPKITYLSAEQAAAVNDQLDAMLATDTALVKLGNIRQSAVRIAVRSLRVAAPED